MANFRCLIVGLMIISFFNSLETEGADWRFLKNNFQGEFFYDTERITRSSEEVVGVWLRIVYSKEFKEKEGLDNLSQTVGLWEINCRNKQICLLSTSHYSVEGEILPPQVWLPPEWKPIGPNTIMGALYKELCKKEGCVFEGQKE
ncbi:MAG: surface-adhesin E family protein [Thermodesulfobacteriota bacterium]